MREAIRGYAAALLEPLDDAEVAVVASELQRFEVAVTGSDELFAALTDGALPVALRLAVVADLLPSAHPAVQSLVAFVVRNDEAGEFPPDLEWLTFRSAEEPTRRSGGADPDPVAGHTSANERLEGYASALLEKLPSDQIDEVEDELFRFTRTLGGSRELAATLGNTDLPLALRLGILTDLLRGRANPITARLIGYGLRVSQSRLERHLDWLVERVGEERGRRTATVTSAVELSSDQRTQLQSSLARLTGRTVVLQVDVDAEVLGGLRVVVGDTVIDGTVRRRLNQVRTALVAGAGTSPREGLS